MEYTLKDNVNVENNVLFIKPIVPFYLVRALVKFIEKITKIVYWDGENLKCPVCGRKLYRNSYSKKWINKTHLVHRQKYICSNKECDYEHVTNIDHIVPKQCNYEIEIRNEPYKQGLIGYKSLEKISEHINDKYSANPSRQSVLNFYRETDSTLKKLETEVLKYDKNELSNVIAVYEQFPTVNGEKKAKSVIMDIGTNLILSDEIIPVKDLTPEFNEQTIKNTIKGIDVKGIVTDGDKSYAPIADSLNIIHQHCNFHLKKNLMDELNKILNKIKIKRKSLDRRIKDITLKLPFYKHNKTKKKNKSKLEELKKEKRKKEKELKEYDNYKKRIFGILDCGNEKNAKRRFKLLFNNIKHLPPVISDFIKRLEKNLDRGINHMRYDFLPSTNNQIECYHGVSLPDEQKKIYRTDEGLDRASRFGRIRWTQRNRKTIS